MPTWPWKMAKFCAINSHARNTVEESTRDNKNEAPNRFTMYDMILYLQNPYQSWNVSSAVR